MRLEELIEQFAQNVAAQTDAIRRGDARSGNKHAKKYADALHELRTHGNAGRDALAMQLDRPRMDVHAMAAVFLLRYRTAEAKAVLEAAAREGGFGPQGPGG